MGCLLCTMAQETAPDQVAGKWRLWNRALKENTQWWRRQHPTRNGHVRIEALGKPCRHQYPPAAGLLSPHSNMHAEASTGSCGSAWWEREMLFISPITAIYLQRRGIAHRIGLYFKRPNFTWFHLAVKLDSNSLLLLQWSLSSPMLHLSIRLSPGTTQVYFPQHTFSDHTCFWPVFWIYSGFFYWSIRTSCQWDWTRRYQESHEDFLGAPWNVLQQLLPLNEWGSDAQVSAGRIIKSNAILIC